MGKFLLRFFLLLLIISVSSIIYLSYFGVETDKFDGLIKNKANEVNQNVKLGFQKTKILLYFFNDWMIFMSLLSRNKASVIGLINIFYRVKIVKSRPLSYKLVMDILWKEVLYKRPTMILEMF